METLEQVSAVGLKNILLATDFSKSSAHALAYATSLAKHYGSKLHVLHVMKWAGRPLMPLEPLPKELDPERQEAEAALLGIIRDLQRENIAHDVLLREAPIWESLSDVIERKDIDLLVLGTSGREGVRKLLFGSVAEEVFRRASCPVLTVGPHAASPEKEFRRILFPTDFSLASLNALPYAIALAEEHGAQLVLLHMVVPFPVMDMGGGLYTSRDISEWQERAHSDAMQRLRELVPADASLEAEPQCLVEFGYQAECITGTAAQKNSDLIVMGVKRTQLPRTAAHLPWPITHQVVCHATCPVLTLKG